MIKKDESSSKPDAANLGNNSASQNALDEWETDGGPSGSENHPVRPTPKASMPETAKHTEETRWKKIFGFVYKSRQSK